MDYLDIVFYVLIFTVLLIAIVSNKDLFSPRFTNYVKKNHSKADKLRESLDKEEWNLEDVSRYPTEDFKNQFKGTMKNEKRGISFDVIFSTEYDGDIVYKKELTNNGIRIQCKWLLRDEKSVVVNHIVENRTLDPLLYPEINRLMKEE